MTTRKLFHRRREAKRLTGYDYRQGGMYFITASTHMKICRFGEVEDCRMKLSPMGSILQHSLISIADWFDDVEVDHYVVMPNHFHVILLLGDSSRHLSNIIGSLKSAVSRAGKQRNLLDGNQPLWQRGYYDHIIRSERALFAIRQYIEDNPVNWHLDKLNPLVGED
jgi:putative transposase